MIEYLPSIAAFSGISSNFVRNDVFESLVVAISVITIQTVNIIESTKNNKRKRFK